MTKYFEMLMLLALAGLSTLCLILLDAKWKLTIDAEPGVPSSTVALPSLAAWPRDNLRVVYVRMQKTGSKALSAWLEAYQRREASVPPTPFCSSKLPGKAPCQAACDERFLARVSVKLGWWERDSHPRVFVNAHASYWDLVAHFGEQNTRYITLLRHPLLRVISEYMHRSHGCRDGDRVTCDWDYMATCRSEISDENFDAFMREQQHAPGMRNRQVRMLAGYEFYATHSEEESLQRALSVLQHNLSWVGVYEALEASLPELQARLCYTAPLAEVSEGLDRARAANDTRRVLNVTSERAAELLELNRLDVRLWHAALERMLLA